MKEGFQNDYLGEQKGFQNERLFKCFDIPLVGLKAIYYYLFNREK